MGSNIAADGILSGSRSIIKLLLCRQRLQKHWPLIIRQGYPILTTHQSIKMATENSTAVESQILSGPAPPSATTRLIDFKKTNLGQYENFFAMVIDDLFTPSECEALLSIVQPNASEP